MPDQIPNSHSNSSRAAYILALDIGTSSVRALLFDALGTAVPGVRVQHLYDLTVTHEGEVSVDANTLVSVVAEVIDDALKAAGPLAQQIMAVAADTFWHNLVGIDKSGNPLTPVLTWEDTRPRTSVTALRRDLDEKAAHQRTGARFHASYWTAKLHWLKTTAPDVFARVDKWLSFSDYFSMQLFGNALTSYSIASGTGLFMTRELTWDDELLKALSVRREQLPELGDIHDSQHGLLPEYRKRWPILQSIPWFLAIGDGASACVGSGAISEKFWSLTIGTSSAMRVLVPNGLLYAPDSLWIYLLDAKRAILGGALSEGGNLLNWLDTVLKLPSLDDTDKLIADAKPDGHGLTILPFVSGERSPGWHSEAHATILGLQTHIAPPDLLRAGMESLAYQLQQVYLDLGKTLKPHFPKTEAKVMGSGGALHNSQVLQGIVSDTLNTPLYPSLEREASARGVALLALESLGLISETTASAPELGSPVHPDQGRHDIYQKGAERQRHYYQLLLD